MGAIPPNTTKLFALAVSPQGALTMLKAPAEDRVYPGLERVQPGVLCPALGKGPYFTGKEAGKLDPSTPALSWGKLRGLYEIGGLGRRIANGSPGRSGSIKGFESRKLQFWKHGVSVEDSRQRSQAPHLNDIKRGKVQGFSRKSRRRLMLKLSRIQTEYLGKAFFLSLTYHNNWINAKKNSRFFPGPAGEKNPYNVRGFATPGPCDRADYCDWAPGAHRQIQLDEDGRPANVTATIRHYGAGGWKSNPYYRDVKRDLDTYLKRLRRADPGAAWLWVIEAQKRGAPHFHIVVWQGVKSTIRGEEFKKFLGANWHDVVDKNNQAHQKHGAKVDEIEDLKSYGKLNAYVAKYIAKCEDKKTGLEMGRRWGNNRDIPANPEGVAWLTDNQDLNLKRLFRKWLKARARVEAKYRPGTKPKYSKRFAKSINYYTNCHMVMSFPLWVWRWLEGENVKVWGTLRPDPGGDGWLIDPHHHKSTKDRPLMTSAKYGEKAVYIETDGIYCNVTI